MIEFVNKLTGSRMFVADDRAEEYKAAGHKLAAASASEKAAPAEKVKPKKTTKK